MQSPAAIAGLIVVSSFISEDAAALTAASLAAQMSIDPTLAFAAAAGGIWIGDLGLYALGLPLRAFAGRWKRAQRFLQVAEDALAAKRSSWTSALFASRFIPGTRLPLYTAAGLVRAPLVPFASVTAIAVLVWVSLLFFATGSVRNVFHAFGGASTTAAIAVPLALIAALAFARRVGLPDRVQHLIRKYSRWEFWPAWLFYGPVVLMCAWLSLRYRGIALPTYANPGQKNGGIVAESKFDLLRVLKEIAPERVPKSVLLDGGTFRERLRQYEAALESLYLAYPVVLKPDVAQRGQGFRKVSSYEAAVKYLLMVDAPTVLQEYIPAEKEIGVFYYRFPDESEGHIFAITNKSFPSIVGDGVRTARQLIYDDERASLIAETYLRRLGYSALRVVRRDEKIRLVEAGNHCQGCIFSDGEHLRTAALEEAIDAIAIRIPGFFIGRFDLRYSDDEALSRGEGFQILELNGAASEATNIYDAKNSLGPAYRTLFKQWELVYAIGAANKRANRTGATTFAVIRDWLRFRRTSRCYPAAD